MKQAFSWTLLVGAWMVTACPLALAQGPGSCEPNPVLFEQALRLEVAWAGEFASMESLRPQFDKDIKNNVRRMTEWRSGMGGNGPDWPRRNIELGEKAIASGAARGKEREHWDRNMARWRVEQGMLQCLGHK